MENSTGSNQGENNFDLNGMQETVLDGSQNEDQVDAWEQQSYSDSDFGALMEQHSNSDLVSLPDLHFNIEWLLDSQSGQQGSQLGQLSDQGLDWGGLDNLETTSNPDRPPLDVFFSQKQLSKFLSVKGAQEEDVKRALNELLDAIYTHNDVKKRFTGRNVSSILAKAETWDLFQGVVSGLKEIATLNSGASQLRFFIANANIKQSSI